MLQDLSGGNDKEETASYISIYMIINKLMEEQGLSYTSEELQKSIKEFIKMGGYGDEFTVDDYSLQAGPVGMWIFTNMNFKYNLVMSALEERVVILPSGENISE